MRLSIRCILLAATLAACSGSTPGSVDSSVPVLPGGSVTPSLELTGDQVRDEATLSALEQEARRLAIADGCTGAGQCTSAPVGVKGCGGPRDFVVYCVTATDTAALLRKLDELARAERAYNERYSIASDCMLRTAPAVSLAGQGCRATP